MAASFVAGDCVDLIHNHGLGCAQHLTALLGSEQKIKRFGGGYHECGRLLQSSRPLGLRSVARAHEHCEVGRFKPQFASAFGDFPKRSLQVFADVGCQGFERRHIDHLRLLLHIFARGMGFVEIVNGDQQCGQRFARTSRSRHQSVAPRSYVPPSLLLGRRGA